MWTEDEGRIVNDLWDRKRVATHLAKRHVEDCDKIHEITCLHVFRAKVVLRELKCELKE